MTGSPDRASPVGPPLDFALPSDRNALAIATLGILLLTVMDAIIKSLSGRYSAVEIMYFRNITGLVLGGVLFLTLRPGWPSRGELGHHALRSGVMLCSGLMFFYALGRMPIAELFVYAFTAPIFVALFGAVLLKERLTRPVLGGLALGFSGIVAIVATDPAARCSRRSSMRSPPCCSGGRPEASRPSASSSCNPSSSRS